MQSSARIMYYYSRHIHTFWASAHTVMSKRD